MGIPQLYELLRHSRRDADRSILAYLQDRLQNGDLDPQSQYTDRRNIHDVAANLKQHCC